MHGGVVDNVTYTARMALIARTAVIQARVFPGVKEASERVLYRIGLNMSEAMEIFLRRLIVDERIPFEIIALDVAQLSNEATATASKSISTDRNLSSRSDDRTKGKGRRKKITKSF